MKKKNTVKPLLTEPAREFRSLFRRSRLSHRKAARRLKCSHNLVHLILHGERQPQESLLELARIRLGDESEFMALVGSLRRLQPAIRQRAIAAFLKIADVLVLSMTSGKRKAK